MSTALEVSVDGRRMAYVGRPNALKCAITSRAGGAPRFFCLKLNFDVTFERCLNSRIL